MRRRRGAQRKPVPKEPRREASHPGYRHRLHLTVVLPLYRAYRPTAGRVPDRVTVHAVPAASRHAGRGPVAAAVLRRPFFRHRSHAGKAGGADGGRGTAVQPADDDQQQPLGLGTGQVGGNAERRGGPPRCIVPGVLRAKFGVLGNSAIFFARCDLTCHAELEHIGSNGLAGGLFALHHS